MTLIPAIHLLEAARAESRGVGAFNVIHLETAEAIVMGAERAGLPAILQISENCVAFHGGLRPLAAACFALAHQSSVPVALHLDHAMNEDLAFEAIDLGFGSVMYDGGHLDYHSNVAATVRVVERAHDHGVQVEAELGAIGGKDGAHAFGVRTNPTEAVQFVSDTGVDSLAVAVGSSHAMDDRSAVLDTALIARLRAAVDVPLVLHGSSGASDDQIRSAVHAGITKVNVSTQLNRVFTNALALHRHKHPDIDSRKYVKAGREAVAEEVARLLALFAET